MTRSIPGEEQTGPGRVTHAPQRTRPAVAAAVVTYNHRDAVLALLAFLETRRIPTFVTENACSDGTRAAIRGRFAHVSLLESEANLGGCGGFNCAVLAALSAGTDYILLIDDDALPVDDCIEQLVRFLDEHPEYVFAAPAVYIASKPDTLQETGGGVDFSTDHPVEAWHRFDVAPDLPASIDIDYASACCLMVRADAVMRLGVMDWNYFIFSDDVDWSLRLRRAFGRKAACVTTARVLHDFPWAKPFSPMRLYFFQRNGLYLLARLREGEASKRAVSSTVMRLVRHLLYAWLIGDHETARTLRDALLDAWRGRYGKWEAPVSFPMKRPKLDASSMPGGAIERVLVDITIEDLDADILRAIRRLAGDGATVDLLCDGHRVAANRAKGPFNEVHGRRDGTFGALKDFWHVRRRAYDLTVTDASMAPRRPASTGGRRAAFFHDGALYEASAVGLWSGLAHVASAVLAQPLASLICRRFLFPPRPGRPPVAARPVLDRIGIQPDVGQPWAREWTVPFPPPRASEAAVLRVPAPHVDPADAAWTPLHPRASPETDDEYEAWCTARRRSAATRYAGIRPGPQFSVVVTAADPRDDWLEESVASVRGQTYPAWELVVVDHPSRTTGPGETVACATAADGRVTRLRVEPGEALAAARQRAAQGAAGQYLVFLEAGDVLDSYALAAFAQASNGGRADVMYADEDRLDEHGARTQPAFKPDFSPGKLVASNYIGRPVAVRRALFDQVGGLRSGDDGTGDHDLLLRATGTAREVVHVPDVLCHRRAASGDGPAHRADADHARRSAGAEAGERARVARAAAAPAISVLVVGEGPSPEQELTRVWAGCECLVARSGSEVPARRLNALAERASGRVLLVASSELRPRDGWRDALLEAVQDPSIGLVGGRLQYHDQRLHSAGLVLGIAGAVGRWHHGSAAPDPGYGGWIALTHEVSAVPWQFMAIRRDVLLGQGGFDPGFAQRGFDVDLALRLTTRSKLRHLYVSSTGASFVPGYSEVPLEPWALDDLTLLWERWGWLIRRGDPFSNVNLSLLTEGVHWTTQAESDLRARGAFMAYDRCTARQLGQLFPGRLQRAPHTVAAGPTPTDARLAASTSWRRA